VQRDLTNWQYTTPLANICCLPDDSFTLCSSPKCPHYVDTFTPTTTGL